MDFQAARRTPQAIVVQGTPVGSVTAAAYLAPELSGRLNRPSDSREDLYALGATLYHLMTGRAPFSGDSVLELVHAHLARRPVPPRDIADVPARVSKIILTLLEKDPAARYPSAHGVVADLIRCRRPVPSAGPGRSAAAHGGLRSRSGCGAPGPSGVHRARELRETLDGDYLQQEVGELLAGIAEGADRTAQIVKGLRYFSRLDEDEVEAADVRDGLDATLMLLRQQYQGRITVERQYDDVPAVGCYPGQLNQLFMNQLVNAGQAISGPGTIKVAVRRAEGGVAVTVRDTGPGIPLRSSATSSSRSSPPRRWGRGRGWGWPSATGLSSGTMARSGWTRHRAAGRRLRCGCPSISRGTAPRGFNPAKPRRRAEDRKRGHVCDASVR